jgi:hypothetical protein
VDKQRLEITLHRFARIASAVAPPKRERTERRARVSTVWA